MTIHKTLVTLDGQSAGEAMLTNVVAQAAAQAAKRKASCSIAKFVVPSMRQGTNAAVNSANAEDLTNKLLQAVSFIL